MIKIIAKIISNLAFLFRILYPIVITFFICNAIINYLRIDIGKINDNDFLFNFFGIMLGFALTIFSFIISLIEKVKDGAILRHSADLQKISRMQTTTKRLYSEIKDDISFTFISLLIVGILYVVDYQIYPFHFFGSFYFDQAIMIKSIKLTLFTLNIYAIYDLIAISFRLSDITGLFDVTNNTPAP